MKISNKTRYGIRFMLNLAANYGNDFINIKDIASKENISVKFLENIVSQFKSGDLIQVKRGASGGYRLSKPPESITIHEIIELLEGEIFPAETVDLPVSQMTDAGAVTYHFIDNFSNHVKSLLQNVTLAQMVKELHARQSNIMFYI